MRRYGLFFGLMALLLQNLVFWQIAMPKSMQTNVICEQISTALEQSNMPISHMYMSAAEHSQIQKQHDKMLQHCHFCELFHHLSPITEPNLTLIEDKILVRLIVFAALSYVFFYLRRLFLCPQGRAPPVAFNLA
ncbi:hypothetical protein F975_01209 [Acinetobacter sp. ANC 3789]|uniref:DUF2946 domain-containing protein n=1 Tax=Acinetobacter sp. ANC 3789 TaxID=1217714 RepID=UPI0002CFA3E2|nr:DUF2946 domain-containing protein [Acinetobacter sp. ANC 3789]ENU81344.1 hypothetical protein F975_01209 [Acinetobacter sp. ANC 3789]